MINGLRKRQESLERRVGRNGEASFSAILFYLCKKEFVIDGAFDVPDDSFQDRELSPVGVNFLRMHRHEMKFEAEWLLVPPRGRGVPGTARDELAVTHVELHVRGFAQGGCCGFYVRLLFPVY